MRMLPVSLAALAIAGATATFAADAPTRIPVKAPAYHHNWSGFYAGVNYGTAVSQIAGRTTGIIPEYGIADAALSVGLQAGYNFHYHPNWVAGLEADLNWLGIDRSVNDFNSSGVIFASKADWYGTLRARLGYTSSPSLFYVTGGVAFVHVSSRADLTVVGGNDVRDSTIASGWTAGFGTEVALGGNWSAKAEYLYIDAGRQNLVDPGFPGTTSVHNRFHVFRKGLNYRFGGDQAARIPVHNWQGAYGGVHAGVGLSQTQTSLVASAGVFNGDDNHDNPAPGAVAGVQLGYNWQVTPVWVAGIEGDFGSLGIDRNVGNWNGANFGVAADMYGTLRARVGRSVGQALLYTTAGAAVVRVKNTFNAFSERETATGWTYGGGIEAVLGNHWTAKVEYLLIDAGHQEVTDPNFFAPGTTIRFDNRFHVFRFGVNKKFGT